MYITKIDGNYNYKNKPYFSAKIPEKELIQELKKIAVSESDIVQKHISYLNDMQKGSDISPERKAAINEWLSMKLYEASSFDPVKEEQRVKEQIEYMEKEKTPNKLIRKGKKVLQFIKEKITDEPEYVHPMMRSFNDRKHELSFFEKFRDVFSSYLELIPKSVQEKAKTSKDKPPELEDILKQIGLEKYGLDMSKQSDNIETKGVSIMDSINLSTNKTNIPSQGVPPNSHPQQTIKTPELKEDTFEREDKSKMSKGEKAAIAAGAAGAAAAVTYIATRGKNKKAGKQAVEEGKKIVDTGKKAVKEIIETKSPQEIENIPKKFQELKKKNMEYYEKWLNKIPYDEKEYDRWRAEEYDPFMKRIKEKNLSTVEKKIFSLNPNEQVKEKEEYLRSVLSRARDSEASYYDGLVEFEKYGRKESLFEGFTTNITYFQTKFPENPSEKTVNKFMDICEKFGKSMSLDKYGDLDNHTDGLNFMAVISEKGVITSIDQLKRALEKGKKIIWSNRSINNLKWTLMRAEDAPYKNNKEVKEILQKFYDTAYENKKPFIKTFFEEHGDPNELEHIIL